jgi:enamine deaminase RidA (YjgF/YER057c/UK114 family)
MEIKRFTWLDREFLEVSGESRAGADVEQQTSDLLRRFDAELKAQGLSLGNAARITVFGRDRAARTAATVARSRVFSGNTRVASSSFICAERFDSKGDAALELLAYKPRAKEPAREPVDFSPARNYLRFLRCDGLLFFSGFTSEAANLDRQLSEVLETLDEAFKASGTAWDKVVKLSIFLRQDYKWNAIREVIDAHARTGCAVECRLVDAFAGEKYLIEIEATALA